MLACASCGRTVARRGTAYAFIEPPADAPESVQTTEYASWSKWRQANYHFFKQHLPKDKKRVLDIGAGPSQFRDLFAQHEYIGLDFYPYEQVSIIADITKPLPIADAVFDVVILSNVLEHVPYPLELLIESRRVLKPGGLLLATVPFLLRVHQEPYDYGRYTSFALERFAKDAGFATSTVEPLGDLVDVQRTLDRHFYDELRKQGVTTLTGALFRIAAAVEARARRFFFKRIPASHRYAEGFGLSARV